MRYARSFLVVYFCSLQLLGAEFDFNLLPKPIQGEIDRDALLNNTLPVGSYDFNVKINGEPSGNIYVEFIDVLGVTQPCVKADSIASLGIDLDNAELLDANECVQSKQGLIDIQYDNLNFSLLLSVNKALIMSDYKRKLKMLDHGINSIRLGYDGSTSYSKNRTSGGFDRQSSNLSLNGYANFDAWRFRSNTDIVEDSAGKINAHTGSVYAYRPIIDSKSVLYAGRKSTQSQLFKSRFFTGAEYISQPLLYSPEQTTQVPTISLFLLENSIVRLYQDNQKIYESYYFAGNHEINDYASISRSDIDVEIQDDSGNKKYLTVPNRLDFASVKKGTSYYYFGGGSENMNNDNFVSATHQYGVMDWLSVLYGAEISSTGISLGIGTDISLDEYGGSSIKAIKEIDSKYIDVSYNKLFHDYSSALFLKHKTYFDNIDVLDRNSHKYVKNSSSVYINNHFNDYPVNANVALTQSSYSNSSKIIQGSVGIHGAAYDVNYNVNYTRILYNTDKNTDNTFGISISVPLNFSKLDQASITRSFNAGGGSTSISTSASYDKGSWATYARHQDNSSALSYGGSASYHTGVSELKGFISRSQSSENFRTGAKGGILVSEYGMKLTENITENMMLIHTPSVEGIKYTQDKYESSNNNGLAILANSHPYSVAKATVDVGSVPENVELPTLSISAVASEGAVIYRQLTANRGIPLLIDIMNDSDIKIPFGARASIDGNTNFSMAEGDGKIFIPAMPLDGKKIYLSWNGGGCSITFDTDKLVLEGDMYFYNAYCY
ncbi:type I pilus usher protein FimC [Aeromonas salmonicida]|uniref:fimbria/pilus outer membrane usher protein n=1 Tax=Aeromonas salmonicida TaxID=645 RepID=UPI0010275AC4|nr:fimbria/pilus outer membrane usher protein [Aeromonas salmonicida]VFB09617.1 type I pilus usher protein FimC [Aeromonas salmonicida]